MSSASWWSIRSDKWAGVRPGEGERSERWSGVRAGDESRKQAALEVAVYCYDTLLRLLHPVMPYLTEAVWQAMPHEGESLMVQQWPAEGKTR